MNSTGREFQVASLTAGPERRPSEECPPLTGPEEGEPGRCLVSEPGCAMQRLCPGLRGPFPARCSQTVRAAASRQHRH